MQYEFNHKIIPYEWNYGLMDVQSHMTRYNLYKKDNLNMLYVERGKKFQEDSVLLKTMIKTSSRTSAWILIYHEMSNRN